jgi:hypothetical protein
MKWLEAIALAIVTACVVVLTFEGALLLRETRLKVDTVAGEMQGWNIGVQHTLGDTSAAMLVVAQIGAKERDSFAAQQKVATNSAALIAKITATVEAINGSTLPAMGRVLASADSAVTSVGHSADSLGDSSSVALVKVAKLTDALTARVSDPVYDAILANAYTSMQNISHATADASATMADVRTGVGFEVKQLMAPETKLEIAWHFVIRSVGRFFGY